MSMFSMLEASGSALTAERQRAEVTAANLANANTTRTDQGGPYRRKEVVFASPGTPINNPCPPASNVASVRSMTRC